jgi:trimeric autotransporter adhesin
MNKFFNLLMALSLVLIATISYGRIRSAHFAPPVFWNVFEATAVKNNVTLTWIVTEYNNKNFYIQLSSNGSDWKDIDSIKTKNSPLSLEDYHYSHINNREGRQYYRVKQVDIDKENIGYSKVVSLVLRPEQKVQVVEKPAISFLPNPATDQVRIVNNDNANGENVYTGAKIYDLSGKMVADKKLQSHTNIIIITDLPIGIYIAQIQCSNGKVFTEKIIKQ